MKNKTKLIGIINITPDSFSGDGIVDNENGVFSQAKKLISEGAEIIDIGAESTRPKAIKLSHAEEWERLEPVLNKIKNLIQVEISIDSYHPETIEKALALGANWINDVSGFSNPKMLPLASKNIATLVVMHSLGIPADSKKTIDKKEDVIQVVYDWGKEKIKFLQKNGIEKDRIVFDPGIGFGKTAEQSLALIRNIDKFKTLGVRIMVGHSRKSFLSLFTDKPAKDRDEETCIVSSFLAKKEVDYLRVHNIKSNKAAIEMSLS